MEKLTEKIRKLQDKFEKRRKEIDEFMGRVLKISEDTEKMLDEVTKTAKTLTETVDGIQLAVEMLVEDYKKLKKDMDRIKNNFWLRLFRVKYD